MASSSSNPIRSIIAVLGGLAVVSLVTESLEFTLVTAASGGTVADMAGYFQVRNRPAILAAKLVYNTLAGVLGGYMTAKVAGARELRHGVVVAVVQTAALIWGFTAGEYAAFTPAWMRVALLLLTGPAMVAGASVRAKAVGGGQ
ncbi:MAG: hypothetical protein HY824_16615 [Acidobacteria bacterium]|nr:hypothetical protein [Acidobacteriota bacterium]